MQKSRVNGGATVEVKFLAPRGPYGQNDVQGWGLQREGADVGEGVECTGGGGVNLYAVNHILGD